MACPARAGGVLGGETSVHTRASGDAPAEDANVMAAAAEAAKAATDRRRIIDLTTTTSSLTRRPRGQTLASPSIERKGPRPPTTATTQCWHPASSPGSLPAGGRRRTERRN